MKSLLFQNYPSGPILEIAQSISICSKVSGTGVNRETAPLRSETLGLRAPFPEESVLCHTFLRNLPSTKRSDDCRIRTQATWRSSILHCDGCSCYHRFFHLFIDEEISSLKLISQEWAKQRKKGRINKIKINFTWDLGIIPTLKNPMFPLSILVQSTTVEAIFSGEGPSQRTASTWRAANFPTKFRHVGSEMAVSPSQQKAAVKGSSAPSYTTVLPLTTCWIWNELRKSKESSMGCESVVQAKQACISWGALRDSHSKSKGIEKEFFEELVVSDLHKLPWIYCPKDLGSRDILKLQCLFQISFSFRWESPVSW